MFTWERTILWFFSGACMGFGLSAFGLGLLPFLFGAILALYGIKRIGAQGFWITLVSLGVVPAGWWLISTSRLILPPRFIQLTRCFRSAWSLAQLSWSV